MADVAQLVRALVCGTGGRGFEPHHSPQVLSRFTFLVNCDIIKVWTFLLIVV